MAHPLRTYTAYTAADQYWVGSFQSLLEYIGFYHWHIANFADVAYPAACSERQTFSNGQKLKKKCLSTQGSAK
jgi:hypothetical protein